MSYPNWVFSMFAFIGFLLSAIPFPWHLEAWNTGTCLFMAWTGLACLNQFINSIIWTGNAINWAPVWCDISTRFMIGSAVAIPTASLCINRRLYHIAVSNTVTVTKAEKRRAIMVDLAIGLGIPILEMVLQYIAQGHRFNIFEDIGCYPFTYATPVAYALVNAWPIAIGLVSAVYCILSIRAFNKRRAQFKELLSGNNNLNTNRYFRLMCLAGIEICCTVPLGSYSIYLNVRGAHGVNPWKGWADTHYGFSRVDQIPAIFWKNDPATRDALESSRWLVIMCAIIFFGFFGFADEARKNYRAAVDSVAKRLGYSSGSFSSSFWNSTGSKRSGLMSSSGNSATLPVYVKKQTSMKRDSFDSFTNMSGSYNEKSFNGAASYGGLSLNDVGGALNDFYKQPYSPASSSGSSSSSIHSLEPLMVPEPAITRQDEDDRIEVSSLRHPSVIIVSPPVIPVPRSISPDSRRSTM